VPASPRVGRGFGRPAGAAFAPAGGGGGGTRLATIEWNTALGSTPAALRDDSNATPFTNLVSCGGLYTNVMAVVEGSTVGWTMTPNVLRITDRGSAYCGNVEWLPGDSPLPASTSHYGRMFVRCSAGFSSYHGISYNAVGTIQTSPMRTIGNASGVQIGPAPTFLGSGSTDSDRAAYPVQTWFPGVIGGAGDLRVANDTWFCYEWFLQYVTPLTYRIWPRLSTMAGVLLYDAATYFALDQGGSSQSLATRYASTDPVINRWSISDAQLARRFQVGFEGPGGQADSGATCHIAGLAFNSDTWVGIAR
jgi:hypothetical protein